MIKTILDKKFIKVFLNEFASYFYSERLGVDSVGFILWNEDTNKFGLVCERKPPLDTRINEPAMSDLIVENGEAYLTTAFGGSNDSIEVDEYFSMDEENRIDMFSNIVKSECREEAGYDVDLKDIYYVGKEFVSTQQNQFCYLFFVQVSSEDSEFEPEYENEIEEQSSIVWLSLDEIYDTMDWKSKVILAKVFGEYL